MGWGLREVERKIGREGHMERGRERERDRDFLRERRKQNNIFCDKKLK